MSSYLDKLNLRPQERRLLVIVTIVVFVVVNLWLVWPHFGDLGRWQQRKRDAEAIQRRFESEIGKKGTYDKQLEKLRKEGKPVADGTKEVELQKEVEAKARNAAVTVTSWSPERRGGTSVNTNFFEEETLQIRVSTLESNLVEFLYSIGSGDSLIRVRSLSLQPDGTRMRLAGDLSLVESFQKARPTARTTPTPAVPKPAGAPPSNVTPPPVNSPPSAKTVTPSASPATPAAPLDTAAAPPKTKSSPSPVHRRLPTPINPTNAPGKVKIPKRQIPDATMTTKEGK